MESIPIATRKSTTKDIDPTTLQRLYHEEGMTIKDIAALCGICAATVRKYVGPVGKGAKPPARKKSLPNPEALITKKLITPVVQVRPKQLRQSKIELLGKTAKFEVDLEEGRLYAQGATFEMLLTKDEVEQFIWELVEAYEVLPRREQIIHDEAKS